MAYQITWTIKASQDFDTITAYLLENWGEKSVRNFVSTLYQKINLIAEMPEICPEISPINKVRRCVIDEHNSLYYRIVGNEIEIGEVQLLTIFGNKQNPAKLKF
jgi:plasmid stabilization system protein ParE